MIDRKLLLENLLRLRSRIEDWTIINGWVNIDNHKVRKDKQGRVVWKLSDWEFVDNMYGAVYNGKGGFGNDYSFNKDTVKTWNKMWHRYKINVSIENANLEPDWEQLQQMDWNDIGDEVSLGTDPAMGVKG